jgi:hypothetical protein
LKAKHIVDRDEVNFSVNRPIAMDAESVDNELYCAKINATAGKSTVQLERKAKARCMQRYNVGYNIVKCVGFMVNVRRYCKKAKNRVFEQVARDQSGTR